MFKRTLLDLWHEEIDYFHITTLCRSLDKYLGNGIQAGKITEFCGGPGSGKTQMCFQLCVNVQIPKTLKGCEGKAVFIDTNQGFNPFRLKEIASSMCEHVNNILRVPRPSTSKDIEENIDFNIDKILENITYSYCDSYVKLLAFVLLLPDMLNKDKNIKLIIIDSFSFVFRLYDCNRERTRLIYQILTDLQNIADKYKIAVVITNEITTNYCNSDNSDNFYLCPALGESYSHKINQRIVFEKDKNLGENHHVVFIEKANNCPQVYIVFKITDRGIQNYKQPS